MVLFWYRGQFNIYSFFSQKRFIVKSNNVRPRKSRYSWKDLTIKILEILMSNNVKIKTLQGRGQLWNEQTTPSQPKLKPGFRLSRHRLSLEKSWPWLLIGLISIADWSDLRDFIPVRTLRASWVGRLQVSCWNIWRPICTFFADCPKDCSHFPQKKLTVTFNLYWFHSFMNLVFFLLSQNILSHHYILWSPCPHYPHPGDKNIKLRCFHPSSTRLGGFKGGPQFSLFISMISLLTLHIISLLIKKTELILSQCFRTVLCKTTSFAGTSSRNIQNIG